MKKMLFLVGIMSMPLGIIRATTQDERENARRNVEKAFLDSADKIAGLIQELHTQVVSNQPNKETFISLVNDVHGNLGQFILMMQSNLFQPYSQFGKIMFEDIKELDKFNTLNKMGTLRNLVSIGNQKNLSDLNTQLNTQIKALLQMRNTLNKPHERYFKSILGIYSTLLESYNKLIIKPLLPKQKSLFTRFYQMIFSPQLNASYLGEGFESGVKTILILGAFGVYVGVEIATGATQKALSFSASAWKTMDPKMKKSIGKLSLAAIPIILGITMISKTLDALNFQL